MIHSSPHGTEPLSQKPLVILGAGGHAVSVANVGISAGFKIAYFIDENKKQAQLLGYSILDNISNLKNITDFYFAIGVGDNASREVLRNKLQLIFPDAQFPCLIHSSAIISHFTHIGSGTVIMPNAVVGPNSQVGNFCLINTQSSLDHDCVMLDYSSLAPGVVTGGSVKIGLRSAISIGATIKHGIQIGNDCVLGSSSYLNKDLSNNQVAYGIPAKYVRSREIGESYLK